MNAPANPEMIVLAREARGLTQKALADQAGVSQPHLSRYESGLTPVPDEQMARIADALDYPLEFFCHQESVAGFGLSFYFHRKRFAATVLDTKKVHARLNKLAMEIARLTASIEIEYERRFPLIEPDHHTPAEIARMIRAGWKLPPGTIQDLTRAVENAGGLVWRCSFEAGTIDGVSHWVNPATPLFYLNSEFPEDRLRFTLAHELGHVIMHRDLTEGIEKEADEFAGEFLMPAEEIADDLNNLTIERAAALKPVWKVSMAALIRRAYDLHRIPESRYRRLFTHLSAAGYRRREPFPLPPEEPTMIRRLVQMHRVELGYSAAELARLLDLHEHELSTQYFPEQTHLRIRGKQPGRS